MQADIAVITLIVILIGAILLWRKIIDDCMAPWEAHVRKLREHLQQMESPND